MIELTQLTLCIIKLKFDDNIIQINVLDIWNDDNMNVFDISVFKLV